MQTFNEFKEGDLLKDLNETVIPPSVDKGTRFANYIIDLILAMVFLFMVVFMTSFSLGGSSEAGLQLSAYIILPMYYVLTEGLLGGRSIGKLVTGTVAIRTDGAPLTWTNILGRSFARLVPFEPISALLGEPWHDKWTNTTVVKKSQLVKY
jgi:uncharacterized RDD family membrane protein YckC